MYQIKPDDVREVESLMHGKEAIETWLLEDIKKYK